MFPISETSVGEKVAREIGLPEETYRLGTGDSLRFPADQPHRYRNPGAEEAQLSMLIWYRG